MTFEEIVAGVESPIVVLKPLGHPEEFIICDRCRRLVRARAEAFQLHQDVTCGLYREGARAEA